MKARLLTIAVWIGLTSTAGAVEWSINSTLRETLEASDNPFLRAVPAGALSSYSTILGTLTGQTKTSRFNFDGDFSYRKYWGPAADGAGGTLAESTDNGLKFHYEMLGKVPREKTYFDATWRRRNAALAILDDFGLPSNATGDIHTSSVVAGFDRSLTPTDFWTWNVRATSTDYVPASGGTQFYNVATTSTFRHQSNSTSALTAQSDFDWLKYDNLTQTDIMIIRQLGGLHVQPIRNLDFNASVGAATVIVQQSNIQPTTVPLASTPGESVSTGLVGNARLAYRLLKTTELALTASQSIGPSITGALIKRQSAGISLRYIVNDRASLTTSGDFSRQTVANGQTDFVTAIVSYNQILARDWNMALSYRYVQRSATRGTTNLIFDPISGVPVFLGGTSSSDASSNSFVLVLSKRFIVLPKRT